MHTCTVQLKVGGCGTQQEHPSHACVDSTCAPASTTYQPHPHPAAPSQHDGAGGPHTAALITCRVDRCCRPWPHMYASTRESRGCSEWPPGLPACPSSSPNTSSCRFVSTVRGASTPRPPQPPPRE